MKIAVVGAGAMGSLLAGYLAKGPEEIWAYDVWQAHIEAIQKNGLLMRRGGTESIVRLKATFQPEDPGRVNLMILFVKHGQTRQALRDSLPMIGSHTAVLTLQNGIGNVEIIQEHIADEQILFGLTTLTSELLGPGQIVESFHGKGETYFWPVSGKVDERVKRICSVFNQAGIRTEISPDVQIMIWKKLIVNACYNTLSAIARLKVGDLIDEPEIRPVLRGVLSEIVQVARQKRIPLQEEEAKRFMRQVGEEARDHFPSMLIDIKKERKTEIDCLNGAIIREGNALGIPTPFNKTLYGIVRMLENTYHQRLK